MYAEIAGVAFYSEHEPTQRLQVKSNLSADVLSTLPEQIVAQHCVDGVDTIFPIHFFAFAVGAAVIRNAHFVNAASRLRQLCRYFWLEPEPIFAKIKILHQRRAERFVARL